MTDIENNPLNQWLDQETPETVIEPEQPIIDPHYPLWDIRKYTAEPHARFLQKVYLCEEYSNDIKEASHNIVQTVFAECHAFFRDDGPDAMKCIGETEFANSIAAMSQLSSMTKKWNRVNPL